jgi:hypothetical protein
MMGPQPSKGTKIYTKEGVKQTSCSVKREQMEETILLKTSDGSIEASLFNMAMTSSREDRAL